MFRARLASGKTRKLKARQGYFVIDLTFVADYIEKTVRDGMDESGSESSGKKNKKLKKKAKQKAETDAAEAAAASTALATFETEDDELLQEQVPRIDRLMLSSLGGLLGGANLTKTELDRAMAEMIAAAPVENGAPEVVTLLTFNTWLQSESEIVAKINATRAQNDGLSKKERKKAREDQPTTDQISVALFQKLDLQHLGELDRVAFQILPEVADVELTESEIVEAWTALDPEYKDEVVEAVFCEWFDSGSPISDKIKADDNGALLALGTEYKTHRKALGRGKSLDAERIVVVYKEDVEADAREKASETALKQDGAWRHGNTVLSEIDAEDLVGRTIDVEGQGRGKVTKYLKKAYFVDTGGAEPLKLKLPSKKVNFSVLSTEFVDSYIEMSINKAIAKWAAKVPLAATTTHHFATVQCHTASLPHYLTVSTAAPLAHHRNPRYGRSLTMRQCRRYSG